MAYFVQIEEAVFSYLASVGSLTDDARQAVVDGMIEDLGRWADQFLTTRQLAHESYHFRYDYPHPDATTGMLFAFEFVCDGSAMAQGVVLVVFVEHSLKPLPGRPPHTQS